MLFRIEETTDCSGIKATGPPCAPSAIRPSPQARGDREYRGSKSPKTQTAKTHRQRTKIPRPEIPAGGQTTMRGRKPSLMKIHKPKPALDAPAKAPRCPAILKGEARREWRRLVPLLLERGTIAEQDRAA